MNDIVLRATLVLGAILSLLALPTPPGNKACAAPVGAAVAATEIRLGDRADDDSNLFRNPLSANDMNKVNRLAGSVQVCEWLGLLSPIAISPFFGIAMLAGMSQFGSDALPFNEFTSDSPILSNPATFWIFLLLTLVTSLPRLTKVSKPAAQAIDQLETYAAIITIVLLRVLAASTDGTATEAQVVVMQAGMFAFSADVLMSIVAIINIIVINTIKFFFEVSVWLIPLPMVDAALEVANKSTCVALMGIYAYNPALATGINLLLFVGCLWAFYWVKRRTTYLHTLLWDPLWAMVSPRYAVPQDRLTVFPQQAIGPFKAKSKLTMQVTESGWSLTQYRFLLPTKRILLESSENTLALAKGLVANRIEMADGNRLLFSRRHAQHFSALAEQLNLQTTNTDGNGLPLPAV